MSVLHDVLIFRCVGSLGHGLVKLMGLFGEWPAFLAS